LQWSSLGSTELVMQTLMSFGWIPLLLGLSAGVDGQLAGWLTVAATVAGACLVTVVDYLVKIPSRSKPLGHEDGYNFRRPLNDARDKGPRRARRELRDLCDEATLKYLSLQAVGVNVDSKEVHEAMGQRLEKAEELSRLIVKVERTKPESKRQLNRRLKQKLKADAIKIEADARRSAAFQELVAENMLRIFNAQNGATTTVEDIVDELAGLVEGRKEVQKVDQSV
jgi:hypothetical protein